MSVSESGITTLRPGAPGYPDALRQLPQPPETLFVRGQTELLALPGIAVVGTRNHSSYGRDATVSFVVGLVHAGYIIISGLARGIDAIAHQTALEHGGYTIAVLGCGLDVDYPPEHASLARQIAQRGCLVSEFPLGTVPRKFNFPRRNRIISGLARATLIVEAPQRSGALITAGYALEEGKEVFAVPGPINSAASLGPNRLIQDGAGLAISAADILAALRSRIGEPLPAAGAQSAPPSAAPGPAAPPADASQLASRIWSLLDRGEIELEQLTEQLRAAPEAVAGAILELELAGLVERHPGPRYARARPQAQYPT